MRTAGRAAARRGAADRPGRGAGGQRRPRRADRSPRPEARQPVPAAAAAGQRGGAGEDPRLRHRQAGPQDRASVGAGRDPGGGAAGHAAVHVARAVPGHRRGGRARGHLFARLHPVRDAGRAAAVRVRLDGRAAGGSHLVEAPPHADVAWAWRSRRRWSRWCRTCWPSRPTIGRRRWCWWPRIWIACCATAAASRPGTPAPWRSGRTSTVSTRRGRPEPRPAGVERGDRGQRDAGGPHASASAARTSAAVALAAAGAGRRRWRWWWRAAVWRRWCRRSSAPRGTWTPRRPSSGRRRRRRWTRGRWDRRRWCRRRAPSRSRAGGSRRRPPRPRRRRWRPRWRRPGASSRGRGAPAGAHGRPSRTSRTAAAAHGPARLPPPNRAAPAAQEEAATKNGRPIYRGTQLQIEKNDPYR